MKKAEIEAANATIREMRQMIESVRTVAVSLKDEYAEALVGVAVDCLQRLNLREKPRK